VYKSDILQLLVRFSNTSVRMPMPLRHSDSLKETVPSHRPLAAEDPVIDALDADTRRVVANRWAERADNELATSTTFAELYRGLILLEVEASMLAVAARAVEDELRHHLICRYVAGRYGGANVREPRFRATDPPRFSGCTEREARVLHTVLHLCLNEGMAAAYLGACLDEAEGPLAKDTVRDILRDEVVHARLGWTFVSALSPVDRTLVAEALPQLLSEIEAVWQSSAASTEELPTGHGVIGPSAIRHVFGETLRDLVLPGFDHVGVGTVPARAWLAEKALWT
jgi:hypothetical protein